MNFQYYVYPPAAELPRSDSLPQLNVMEELMRQCYSEQPSFINKGIRRSITDLNGLRERSQSLQLQALSANFHEGYDVEISKNEVYLTSNLVV